MSREKTKENGRLEFRHPIRRVFLLLAFSVALCALFLCVGTVSALLDSHLPIYIHGDANFTPQNGVKSGSGVAGDPYIIEGRVIDASSADGIHIRNTTAYFVIRNVLVENGRTFSGIFLENVRNGRIENVVSRNSYYGIFLYYSSNSTISGNTAENNHEGIFLYYSSNSTISGNTAGSNNYGGIYLYSSSNNTLSGNTVENNPSHGIYLYPSSNNTISGNTAGNNECGIYLDSSPNNTLSGNIVENNSWDGIYLSSSPNNTLSGNIVENNYWYGIYLSSSNGNILSNNIVQNSSYYGIRLHSSSNNTLSNNTCKNNGQWSIYLEGSSGNTFRANTYDNASGMLWISAVSSSNITGDSATITWKTAGASDSKVEYDSSTVYDPGMVTGHSLTLTSLSAGTTYTYRVWSKDSDNNTEISQDYMFTTITIRGPLATEKPWVLLAVSILVIVAILLLLFQRRTRG